LSLVVNVANFTTVSFILQYRAQIPPASEWQARGLPVATLNNRDAKSSIDTSPLLNRIT
jgi:hypothetical protein